MTPRLPVLAFTLASLSLVGGCQKQQSRQEGKVYTSTRPKPTAGGSGAGSASSSSSQPGASKPLDAPAETINLRASQASDNGSTQASVGQVIANPGAPDAQKPKAAGSPPGGKAPTGSH